MKQVVIGLLGAGMLLVAGCAGEGSTGETRFIGFNKCAPDGSPVWFQTVNAQGTFEGAEASEENCKKG